MPGGAAVEGVSAKRVELAGNKVGWRGLVRSKKTFGISLFASLGGLVYGCKCARIRCWYCIHNVQRELTNFLR